MTLVINGEEKTLSESLTLADLITNLGLKSDRVAVELNREIVSRQNWPATHLKNGDRLEIVHFVGGGCAPFLNIPSAAREPCHCRVFSGLSF